MQTDVAVRPLPSKSVSITIGGETLLEFLISALFASALSSLANYPDKSLATLSSATSTSPTGTMGNKDACVAFIGCGTNDLSYVVNRGDR